MMRAGRDRALRGGGGTCRWPSRARRAGSRRTAGPAPISAHPRRPGWRLSPVRSRFSRRRSSRDFGSVDRGDLVAGGGQLHRLAAGRRAEVEDVAALSGISRAGSEAARSCTHQRPSPKPGRSTTEPASFEPDMARRERHAAGAVAKACASASSAKLRSSGGRLAICRRADATTSSPQAARQRCSTASGRRGASIGGTPRRSRVPSTPWTSRRGPPSTSGRAVATSAWSGVPRPTFCASARRSTIRALLSSGSRCRVALSIRASRSGSRRSTSPAMAIASPWSAGFRPVDACAAASSVCPRRSTASSICSAARRAGEAFNAWHKAFQRTSSCPCPNAKRPEGARLSRPSRRRCPKPEAGDESAPPAGEEQRLDPTRYGDWEKKGIAVDF